MVLRSMPDIVVATPGRMIDHLRNSMSVDLDDLAVLILDEADRLLQTGFATEIQELVSFLFHLHFYVTYFGSCGQLVSNHCQLFLSLLVSSHKKLTVYNLT